MKNYNNTRLLKKPMSILNSSEYQEVDNLPARIKQIEMAHFKSDYTTKFLHKFTEELCNSSKFFFMGRRKAVIYVTFDICNCGKSEEEFEDFSSRELSRIKFNLRTTADPYLEKIYLACRGKFIVIKFFCDDQEILNYKNYGQYKSRSF